MRIGISACLLGRPVRYDGGHKQEVFLTDTFGRFVEYVPVCPEVECGLGIPREPMRLVGDPQSPRLVTVRTKRDHTERMIRWANERIAQLQEESLCGFIFKSRSPSSGMRRVKVYTKKGVSRNGRGIFAGLFMDHLPLVPVEDEGRLRDPGIRENFIDRVFTMRSWRECRGLRRSRHALAAFHTENELLLRSHSVPICRRMGELLSDSGRIPLTALFSRYETMLSEILTMKALTRNITRVLCRSLACMKKDFSAAESKEVYDKVEQYRNGTLPLIVLVTLIQHYARKYDQHYLMHQAYLNPDPISLQMRNHA